MSTDAADSSDVTNGSLPGAEQSSSSGVRSVSDIVSSGTDDPLSNDEIQQLRQEINRLDAVILDAIKRRSQISQRVGQTRMGSGGTRLVHTREVAIINEFRNELGPEGPAIATALLRMGRGRLG